MRVRNTDKNLRRDRGAATALLAVLALAGCNPSRDTFIMLPVPVQLKDGLLTTVGAMEPTRGPLCGGTRDDSAPAGSGSPFLLVDTATPLSVFVPAVTAPPLPFRHGEVNLRSFHQSGELGAVRVLICDVPMIRTNLNPGEFRLDRGGASTGPLGGVVGGDLLARFAVSLTFAGTLANKSAQLTLTRSDIGTTCQLDDAVLPFRPLGGQLAVGVGDAVVTYPATRVTVSACVEPLADPLRPEGEVSCLDHEAALTAQVNLTQALNDANSQTPRDEPTIERIANWLKALQQVTSQDCQSAPDPTDLSNVIADQRLLRPAFYPSGADMQFLVSTAVPDLILSETACKRLGDPSRCQCTSGQVKLRLPGLNPTDADAEVGCPIQLGSSTLSALALVARQRYLSACGELARSRRQRYALPSLGVRPVLETDCTTTSCQDCRRSACLIDLLREPSMSSRRCGYSGPDPQYACDDDKSPVAAVVELGGPQYAAVVPPGTGPDRVDALVVPDTARILQSANADIRSDGPQIDGVIGLTLLSRLSTTIDYPQQRVAWSCRCGDDVGHVCRAYRGTTYNAADSCSQDGQLQIPNDYGRSACRP